MKTYYAYIRVSTTRQGEEGVSLQEQKSAILDYASKRGIAIGEWFEEQVTAAKRGRPIFGRVVSLLKSKKSAGLIIHKIDRGARNLRDWADIAELMDHGTDVHFAHESIDLHSRSGRLSADILAVVASDYIRNLREETIKGINGRLKQGLFPFSAPIGYLNNGKGKVKTIDPVLGPLIKIAFELYMSGRYSVNALRMELFERGLRTRTGKPVTDTQLALVLRNPFYIGLMRIRGRKETYPGLHSPLIPSSTFNAVQFLLSGKRSHLHQHNRFLFSRLIFCRHCGLNLVGERQKDRVYYRCHRKLCPVTCIRQDRLEEAILGILKKINIVPEEEPILKEAMSRFSQRQSDVALMLQRDLEKEHEQVEQALKVLLQKLLDDVVPKEIFDDAHTELLMQRKVCEEKLDNLRTEHNMQGHLQDFIAGLRSVCERFCAGSPDDLRKLMESIFTRIETDAGNIHIISTPVMQQIAEREKTEEGWGRLFPIILRSVIAKS